VSAKEITAASFSTTILQSPGRRKGALALGAYFALLIHLIVFRLLKEGKVLRRELPGYSEARRS